MNENIKIDSIKITDEMIEKHGLDEFEYNEVKKLLGREPNYNELGVFSVMWSEHCGYKNSKPLLKTLPTEGELVLQGPGENAGIIDIGDGDAVVFKIESHNHPSAVEPYQGAATGVGGILRDIFTMGARPVAMLNSLKFGNLVSAKTKRLMRGVVKGIGDYGNCIGVPTVAGEIGFDAVYEDNILVNAMCVGLMKKKDIIRGYASGVGNPVIYFGSSTGRDGIHGATFASEELNEEGEDKRPSVQVGDPFMEKLLMEATVEMIEAGLFEGIQDMGAAGLTSSSCEMASRAGTGIDLSLDPIPKRASDLTPYEMLLSESQERMLAVATPDKLEKIGEILEKWDLHFEVIGKVTDSGHLKVTYKGEEVADIPVNAITDDVPTYKRSVIEPEYIKAQKFAAVKIDDFNKSFIQLVGNENIASKRWIFEQYDYMVKTDTVVAPGQAGGSLIRVNGTKKGIAVTTDSNGRYGFLNPYNGAAIAVAEAARNIAALGAEPLGVTNCLNFSNPEKPHIYYQLAKGIEGMGDACRAFDTPVTGGNASLYNETNGREIYPTIVIGMVGVMADVEKAINGAFKSEGDSIYLIGDTKEELGGSLIQQLENGKISGDAPAIDLQDEKVKQDLMVALVDGGLLASSSDIAEGGLSIALAESCFGGDLGAEINYEVEGVSTEALLFGETQGRYVVSVKAENKQAVEKMASGSKVKLTEIGKVGGKEFKFNQTIAVPLYTIRDLYFNAIEKGMEE